VNTLHQLFLTIFFLAMREMVEIDLPVETVQKFVVGLLLVIQKCRNTHVDQAGMIQLPK